MRVISLALAGALAASVLAAQPVSRAAAARDAAIYNGPTTKVKGWIWSDKYVYQAGQALTLHCRLRAYRGEESTRTIDLPVPRDLARDADLALVVAMTIPVLVLGLFGWDTVTNAARDAVAMVR